MNDIMESYEKPASEQNVDVRSSIGFEKRLKGHNSSSLRSLVLHTASWNIAAINNNPFEYWITNPNSKYEKLMVGIQSFIQNPANDIPLKNIFTDEMFRELCAEMKSQGISGCEEFSRFWTEEFRSKFAITGFLKDKTLGLKRLASMPDRITNTINLSSGGRSMRPTVINAYSSGSLESVEAWWKQWKIFMFHTSVHVSSGRSSEIMEPQVVCNLLSPILRSKYPAITKEEQAVSVPLQILCLAILDSILVYMVNHVSPLSWESVRRELCEALIINKSRKVQSILAQSYSDMDVIFIQEAAAIFVQNIQNDLEMHGRYAVLLPWNLDGKRDQNSMILVRRERFRESSAVDLTRSIFNDIEGSWVAPGDLVVYSIEDVEDNRWLMASFHGDSNGLSTQPFMEVLDQFARKQFSDHFLIVGLDANTHSETPDIYYHSIRSFVAFITDHGMQSSWGPTPDASLHTTCSARTFLQTQFNKAVSYEERLSKKSLKDWIVVYKHQVNQFSNMRRDNTGSKHFVDGLVLPSLQFPSDHAMVSATVEFQPIDKRTDSLNQNTCETEIGHGHEASSTNSGFTADHTLSLDTESKRSSKFRKKMTFATLYEYWGINEKPTSDVALANCNPTLTNIGKESTKDRELSLEEEIDLVCEEYYFHLVTNPRGANLDTRSLIFSKIEDKSIWILFSSRPVSMTLSKPWGQLLFVSMSLQYLLEYILNLLAILYVSDLKAAYFRLTPPLHWRNVTESLPRTFGLVLDGCVLDSPQTTSLDLPALAINFSEPVSFNGWFLNAFPRPGQTLNDYRLEASLNGVDWKDVLPPPWISKESYALMPAAGDRDVARLIDMRPAWPWTLFWSVGMLGMVFGMLVPSLLGAMGRGRQAAIAESVAVVMLGALACVSGIYTSFISSGDSQTGVLYWMMGLELFCLAWIFFTERYTVHLASPVFSLFGITTYFFKQSHCPNPVSKVSEYLPLVWTVLPSVAAIVQNISRYLIKRWIFTKHAEVEKSEYDAVWRDICADDANIGSLESLKTISERLKIVKGCPSVHQIHPSEAIRSVVRNAPHLQQAYSLDQLFNQGAALDPFLRRLIQRLALKCSGFFPVESEANKVEFQKWEDLVKSGLERKALLAKLKPTERALEKLLRSYNCEVSRLLDVCRQSIVFEKPSDVAACLQVMAGDGELEIVRMKNRMDPAFDSNFCGGFR